MLFMISLEVKVKEVENICSSDFVPAILYLSMLHLCLYLYTQSALLQTLKAYIYICIERDIVEGYV